MEKVMCQKLREFRTLKVGKGSKIVPQYSFNPLGGFPYKTSAKCWDFFDNTGIGARMSHRKWREIKQQLT